MARMSLSNICVLKHHPQTLIMIIIVDNIFQELNQAVSNVLLIKLLYRSSTYHRFIDEDAKAQRG